jgi:predicted ester cyclase
LHAAAASFDGARAEPAMGDAAFNRELGFKINREIWNERRFDRIAQYFAEDFVADYSPYAVRRGRDELRAMVERAHATFENFREEVKAVIADEHRVVVHFTIKGRQVGAWGVVPPTGKEVAFDEIVIMTVENRKVVHQVGVVDNLLALRQLGIIPGP